MTVLELNFYGMIRGLEQQNLEISAAVLSKVFDLAVINTA